MNCESFIIYSLPLLHGYIHDEFSRKSRLPRLLLQLENDLKREKVCFASSS